MVYIVNVLLIIVYAFFSKRVANVDKRKFFLVLCLIQMSLIVGLRYRVGADYSGYERLYSSLGGGIDVRWSDERVEIGYRVLNWLFWQMKIPFWGLNLFIATLTHSFVFKAIYNTIDSYWLTVMAVYLYISLFFFYHSMNMSRQGLAIAIGIYAVTKLMQEEKRKFIILILLAASLHLSLILFLILLILKDMEIRYKTLFLYAVGTIGIVIGYELIERILTYTKYGIYINTSYNTSGTLSTILNLGVRLIILVWTLLQAKHLPEGNQKNILYHMALLCTVVQAVTVKASMFGRITTLFFIGYIILIPQLIGVSRKRTRQLLYFACFVVATLYQCVYFSIMGDSVLVNTYQSIFSMEVL